MLVSHNNKSKQKRYIHFGGRAAFHDECGLQCARFFQYISDSRIRKEGAGRKPITETCSNITEAIEKIIDGSTYGDPSRELHWVASTLSLRKIRDILEEDYCITASHEKISQLLTEKENIGNFKNAGAEYRKGKIPVKYWIMISRYLK